MKRVSQLGYLAFEVSDLAAWERFATEVLGMVVARRYDRGFSLRLDGHAQRIFVSEGPADDLAAIGWQVDDAAALDEIAARVPNGASEGTSDERAHRGVTRLVHYVDPGGIPSELFFGPEIGETPFVSSVVRAGFVADAQGLGHIVISAPSQAEGLAFYRDVLGFRLSDRIVTDLHGYHVDIVFLHANARHHSVAFGERQRKRLHHFMLEARSVDDVGLALDRTLAAGLRLMQTLGRHPNDRMLSFYAKTPSGFQFELGWGGRPIDDATWEPTEYDQISEWGHTPPERVVPQQREEKR